MFKFFRQAVNKLHCLRASCSFFDLLIRQISSKVNVAPDGVSKQNIILEYYTKFCMQFFCRNGRNRTSSNPNAAGTSLIQPHQQVDNGALASTGRANNAQRFTLFKFKGNV